MRGGARLFPVCGGEADNLCVVARLITRMPAMHDSANLMQRMRLLHADGGLDDCMEDSNDCVDD